MVSPKHLSKPETKSWALCKFLHVAARQCVLWRSVAGDKDMLSKAGFCCLQGGQVQHLGR